MVSIGGFTDTLILIFFIIILLSYLFGQNWRGWYAARQIRKSLRKIRIWRDYGINIIKKEIDPYLPSSITENEAEKFIEKMIEFFVVAPTKLDPPIFSKLQFLVYQKDKRYKQLIQDFLPDVNGEKLQTISTLIQTTSALNDLFKDINHNLILGKKIKSSFHIQKTASKIQKNMIKAQSFRTALDTFRGYIPIGDSIGPLAIKYFVEEISKTPREIMGNYKEWEYEFISYETDYKNRNCMCLRAKGPASNVGNPGIVLEHIFEEFKKQNRKINLIITIDAHQKLEGENVGRVNQGIGISVGGEGQYFIDKYQIETLALTHDPKIPIESITIKESFEDAVSPINEKIEKAIPDIIRILKKIIRSQTSEGANIIIFGIGNALGVKNGI